MYTHTAKTRGSKDIKLYKYRLAKIRLIWPQQVLDLIKFYKIKKINDLGCNYFQFYKEIKKQKLNYDYFGYDIENKFVDIGLKKFSNLKKKYKICNIENFKLRSCDFSIISATLEHTQNPLKVLKTIIKSTKKNDAIRRCASEGYDCEKIAIEKIKHFVSKEALNIDGFGKKL